MSTRTSSTFQITKWDEKPYHEGEGEPKLTRASVTKTFSGDLEGEAFLEYLIVHRGDGTAAYVGMERVKGKLGRKSGTFVLEHRGTYGADGARAICRIVPGSGTGELAGLQGEGEFAAQGREAPFTLDYDFAEGS
jgi:hypothetical protein